MAELRAPEQNILLGRLANMLRATEGDIAAPEFLPKGLDVMGLVRQLMLPSAETVEKLSYGDPLFRMPTQSNIPITADREYLAEVLGMAPAVPAASRATTRLSNEAADQLVRMITRNPEATAPQVLEAAGQMLPLSRMISPEVAAKVLPKTKAVDEAGKPVMVYTGSQNEIEKFNDGTNILRVASGWFTDKPKLASAYAVDPTRAAMGERSPTVYPSYLDLRNPVVVDAKGANWDKIKIDDKKIAEELEVDSPVSTDFLAYLAKQKGYDGVIIKNVEDNPNTEVSGLSDVYVPFRSEQIRSATSDPQMAGLLDQPAQSVEKIYHGTSPKAAQQIERSGFDITKSADGTVWFTSNPEIGEVAATGKGAVVERLIDLNDLKLGGWDETDRFGTDELIQQGYDGLRLVGDGEVTYQIFNPEKLKKAIK